MLKEIGAKIFQPPSQEVPSEQTSMFLEGYSLLMSACELTDAIPESVKVSIVIASCMHVYYIWGRIKGTTDQYGAYYIALLYCLCRELGTKLTC